MNTHLTADKATVTVRELREEDIDAVLNIDKQMVGNDRARSYAPMPGSCIGGDLDVSVVAEMEGEIVGLLLGYLTDSPYGMADCAWMNTIGVDPKHRRQGIARQLVEAFETRCRKKGVRTIHIMVSQHDQLLSSFLNSLSFKQGEMTDLAKQISNL